MWHKILEEEIECHVMNERIVISRKAHGLLGLDFSG
jgi:hypothetical protein